MKPCLILFLLSQALLAENTHFGKTYDTYLGKEPTPHIKKCVALKLKQVSIDSKDVAHALMQLTETMRTQYQSNHGLSFVMPGNHPQYHTPIKLHLTNTSLMAAVDAICKKAKIQWNFSSGKLTITPPSSPTK
ncbi:hypothetical protein [Rubritalea tangerina]|uniref:Uncharacterized protein n=1 Tax=Rubritalea tangerina TaxID=430798 RepID=A0ABW4ZF48_9BACT